MITSDDVQQYAHLIVRDPDVARELLEKYGDKAEVIKARLITKMPLGEDENDVIDTLHDMVLNNGKTYSQFLGVGDYGEYPIDVKGLGEAYWVEAQDHDDEGFFDSIEAAEDYIGFNWNDNIKPYTGKRVAPSTGNQKNKEADQNKSFVQQVFDAIDTKDVSQQENLYKEYCGDYADMCEDYLGVEFDEYCWKPEYIGLDVAAERLLNSDLISEDDYESLLNGDMDFTDEQLQALEEDVHQDYEANGDGNYWAQFIGEIEENQDIVYLVVRRHGCSFEGVEEELVGWYKDRESIPCPDQYELKG